MKKIALIILSLLVVPMFAFPALAANYTAADVAVHNTVSDCWMILNNNVYNLTAYIPVHSGGTFISSQCGKDGTALFNSGPHPIGTINLLNPYLIGTLSNLVLTSVSVSPSAPSVAEGGTIQLTATPKDQNGTNFTGATTTFSSNDTAIASVDNNGLVTAVAQGSAVITATSVSGIATVSGTSNITVTAPVPAPVLTNVVVSPLNTTMMVGSTQQLTATTFDQNNAPISSSIFFGSNDPAVITVDNNGLVTATGVGTSSILVTAQNGTSTVTGLASFTIIPIPVLTTTNVSPATSTILVGATQQLAVTTLDQNNSPIAASLTFTSSDTNIATVDSSGLVTGLSAGTVTITASAVNGVIVNGTADVTVNIPPPAPILSISTDKATSSITVSPSLIASTGGQANDNALVDATFNGVTPLKLTITNTGNADSQNLLIAAVNGGSNIQLWSKDSSNNWLDINTINWGGTSGFPIAIGATTTINVFPLSDATGTYPLLFNLIQASDSSVVGTASSSVTVNSVIPTAPINLLSAGNFVILSKAGITDVPTSTIIGNIGASPIAGSSITGVTAPQVTGIIYTVDATGPASSTPNATLLTKAISDMEAAYTSAASLPSGSGLFLNIGGGNLGGLSLSPGVYTFGNSVTIPTDLTLNGGPNDVWIFQIAGTLDTSASSHIILSGGAQAQNIYWQVAGQTTLGANSVFNGNILDQSGIAFQTGASLTGRALAQTAVTLDQNTISLPDPSASAAITAFSFSSGSGVINETNHTISVSVPNGTDVTALVPTIIFSGSAVTPSSGVAQNFSNPVSYAVTATNGTTKDYSVSVSVLPPVSNGGGGGGGGGGGYIGTTYCNAVTFGDWGPIFNGVQFRNVISSSPNFCSLTPDQQAQASRAVNPITNEPLPGNNGGGSTTPSQGVLGEKIYANGTLLKGSGNRIYVVLNGQLQYVTNLSELAKYKGAIIKVDDSVIAFLLANGVQITTGYKNGALLRDNSNYKIYVVIDNKLQYIPNLNTLAKYKGSIINVDSSIISSFAKSGVLGVKIYADGSLIRAYGNWKVYVIMNGKKVPILSPNELKKYAGKTINNVDASELNNY